MVRGGVVQLLDSGFDGNSIRESEGLRLLPQELCKIRAFEKILLIRGAHCRPLIRKHDSASAGVDNNLIPVRVDEPFSWQLMNILEGSISAIRKESSLVSGLQVVCDM